MMLSAMYQSAWESFRPGALVLVCGARTATVVDVGIHAVLVRLESGIVEDVSPYELEPLRRTAKEPETRR